MTELATIQPTNDLTAQMEFSRVVSSASMLPDNYRNKPADIMLAVGLGQSMGLSPAESLYRISVIKGKPTAGAELIAANVRKAGHRLRVATDEQAVSVTATIIRADDPEFAFEVKRDMDWAKSMGLASGQNYQKQPITMLQWRAITACARLACPEALYGVSHTPDEMGDFGDERPAPSASRSAHDRMGAVLGVTAEQVRDEPQPENSVKTPEPMAEKSRREMFALFSQKGIADDKQLAGINQITGADYASRADLTEDDCRLVIDRLRAMPDTTPTPADEPASAE